MSLPNFFQSTGIIHKLKVLSAKYFKSAAHFFRRDRNLRESWLNLCRQRRRLRAVSLWMKKMRMNTAKPCVEHAVKTMRQTSSGFAVTSARSGFTGSA